MEDQYHHYIPRFLLRNFAINNYERIFSQSIGLEIREDDTFTFPFVKVTSATVHLVNTIFLNETKPDLVLTFLSRSYLYKTIIKYHKDKKEKHPSSLHI
ncbi:hypothetical protein G9A89_021100 [Geosiphon pyriformis]|nr:hypothetical protein G9A89_021100 [Geosiphon pyriformis]